MKLKLIENGTIVSKNSRFKGYILIKNDRIAKVSEGEYRPANDGLHLERKDMEVIDATGCVVMPGVIDDQVHFREPGMTYKADTKSESAAAAAGGVTSFMDMPNTNPATTDFEALDNKFENAAKNSVINYSFYLGATNQNSNLLSKIDTSHVCGVKLFMGSSTGNMLVDREAALAAIFEQCPILIATHCEDESTVRSNFNAMKAQYGDTGTAQLHPLIRSAEACYRSSAKAVELASRYNSRLHVLHLSTARELELFSDAPLEDKKITNEVCVHHLWFSDKDYALKGNMIKWNPAIKTTEDRDALRAGLLSGKVDVVATDHAPHTLEEKSKPYFEAPSGGPMISHSLVTMLEMSTQGVFSIEQVVDKMCHAPARLFNIKERGFLREGYYADIAIVKPSPWVVDRGNILYKCGWSPLDGQQLSYKVDCTIVNGKTVYDGKTVIADAGAAMALEFER